MEEERVFTQYGTLTIDLINNTCTFMDGEGPDIVIDGEPIKYINFGIPLGNVVTFHDPYADQSLDINDRPRINVRYQDFSVTMHNDPDNRRSYMDFRNVELLTPYDYGMRRFITWEEYDAEQKRVQELMMDKKTDFDQIVEYIQKMGCEKEPKKHPMRATVYSEEGIIIYDYRFLARYHTLDPQTNLSDTWAVFEDMKALVFDDESRINLWISRSGKHIKDQPMYRWFLNFDKAGNITDMTTPWHGDDYLEPSKPCDKLIEFINIIYRNRNYED